MPAPSAISVNWGKIEQRLVQGAMRGGASGARYALERVRRHAPVRKLFRGTTYRTGKSGFREPRPRRVAVEGQAIVGQANSSIPLFRTRNPRGQTEFLSGDFRAVDTSTRRLRKVNMGSRKPGEQTAEELRYFARTRGGKLEPRKIAPVSAEEIRVSGGKAVTSRGRYEIRSGRADFRAPGSAITRVGGRLKGELHVEGPIKGRDGVIWWYVVSATKDPETGRLYPRDQEFGTVRHKAHPFLRPGLHESRDAFRRSVRRGMPGRLV